MNSNHNNYIILINNYLERINIFSTKKYYVMQNPNLGLQLQNLRSDVIDIKYNINSLYNAVSALQNKTQTPSPAESQLGTPNLPSFLACVANKYSSLVSFTPLFWNSIGFFFCIIGIPIAIIFLLLIVGDVKRFAPGGALIALSSFLLGFIILLRIILPNLNKISQTIINNAQTIGTECYLNPS